MLIPQKYGKGKIENTSSLHPKQKIKKNPKINNKMKKWKNRRIFCIFVFLFLLCFFVMFLGSSKNFSEESFLHPEKASVSPKNFFCPKKHFVLAPGGPYDFSSQQLRPRLRFSLLSVHSENLRFCGALHFRRPVGRDPNPL